jgi:hypothetical protein
VLDAVQFEELGLPSTAIITEPFLTTCKAMAELQGFHDYPMVVVPHPITSLTESEVMARADLATEWVHAMLVEGVALPSKDGNSHSASASLDDVVESLAPGLRSDGADLFASMVTDSQIVFRLHIPDQACAECIMPSNILLPIFRTQVTSMLGEGFEVSLDDPREDKDHPLNRA